MIPFHYFTLILFLLNTQFITPIFTMPEKRNFSSLSLSSTNQSLQQQSPLMGVSSNSKKLRRLPHVFSKVLELPFDSDADVVVEERHDCFKFTVEDDGGIAGVGYSSGVKAHVVEVHPGITKVVIRSRENLSRPIVDELELDVWRFRLPSSARPELATAVYARGGLVVIVPKNGWGEMDRRDGDGKGGFKGNMGNLIIVQ
ncbi:uncharacterized protein LOC110727912 [Chenopodium quinoa]|uniref:uncharacterized protein LOC110727912 n=1 Tax=Chenopodium quinoa TaxID=63459 RepID=UPI000B78DB03|nr:uncharacterized protein LOC110727912 [Chenopodium quinoa]